MSEQQSTRAPRYQLRLNMRYREKGTVEWRAGTTQNISQSGVLFLADRVPCEKTRLEMMIQMLAIGTEPAAEIACQGTVVRRIRPADLGAVTALAVEFSNYRLVRGSARERAGDAETSLEHACLSSIAKKSRGYTQ